MKVQFLFCHALAWVSFVGTLHIDILALVRMQFWLLSDTEIYVHIWILCIRAALSESV